MVAVGGGSKVEMDHTDHNKVEDLEEKDQVVQEQVLVLGVVQGTAAAAEEEKVVVRYVHLEAEEQKIH